MPSTFTRGLRRGPMWSCSRQELQPAWGNDLHFRPGPTRELQRDQVEKDQVVQEHTSEIETILAQLGRLHVDVLGLEHQLDAVCDGRIVLDEKETHGFSPAEVRLRSAKI